MDQIPSNGLVFLNAFANPVEHKDDIFLPKIEAEFINKLIQKCERLVVTSFGSPYLIQDFLEAPVYLCAYKGSGILQRAVANGLEGKANITGILPVTIPEVAAKGTSIQIQAKKWPIKKTTWKSGQELQRIRADEILVNISSIKAIIAKALADSAFPGGVLLAAKDGKIFIHEAFGHHTYTKKENVTRGDIYDIASITKVVATTSAVMRLLEQKKLSLDDKVVKHLPAFRGRQKKYFNQKSNTMIRHLITHTAGLPPFKQYFLMDGTAISRLDSVMNTEPQSELEAVSYTHLRAHETLHYRVSRCELE